ncbi:hypothetical protein HID58_005859 [Brassica napus]|uniref:Uncharacterized protein n=3 Tax=Brassica TaxID=3705 RepID=A0ABQ8E9Q9_BRANA|nr:hypothetical protein HID58_005859 [Brassica napus]
MHNKLHGKQANTHRPRTSSACSHQSREEFSDWPHGLLAIGTFGTLIKDQTPIHVVQEVIQEEKTSNMHVEGKAQDRNHDLSLSDDLEDFTPEEVGKLQNELTKLLTRKNKKRKSDVNKELENLPLDRFLNCPSSFEVDRRISNAFSGGGDSDENQEDIERAISTILGRCKAISTGSKSKMKAKRDWSKTSVSYLLKKMFVCTEGHSPLPNPGLRDTFQESRMEKFLRVMLLKKINTRACPKETSTCRYVQDRQQLSLKNKEEEGRSSSDGSTWVKTDSDCEFKIFLFLFKTKEVVHELILFSSSSFWLQSLFLRSDSLYPYSDSYRKVQVI